MLGIIVAIFIIYLSIKMSLQLKKHKEVFVLHGISSSKIIALQFAALLYILSLVGYILPVSMLDLIRPIPIGFLLLLPGIILGKKLSNAMECIGIDSASRAGRTANNIMWLGIGVGIYISANVILGLMIGSIGSNNSF